jgi:predicted PhzF superfamily epimerase YddE/YHI9
VVRKIIGGTPNGINPERDDFSGNRRRGVTIRQGRHVGRPSLLLVDVPEAGGITVTGSATPIS